MRVLIIAVQNVYELFVEDGSLVLIVLAWVALCYAAARWLGTPPAWRAPLLALGCLIALLENIVRAARRAGKQGRATRS